MKRNDLVLLIGIGIILAIIYLIFIPRGIGVLVSCNDLQIKDIRNMPPPLMEIYQPEYCRVNVTVISIDSSLICQKYGSIFNSEQGIIECGGLKDVKGSEVNVTAKFFNLNNTLIGQDNKKFIVNP